jgi:hypothetical protein
MNQKIFGCVTPHNTVGSSEINILSRVGVTIGAGLDWKIGFNNRLLVIITINYNTVWEPPTMQTDYSRRYQKVGSIYTLRIIKIFRRHYPTSSSS